MTMNMNLWRCKQHKLNLTSIACVWPRLLVIFVRLLCLILQNFPCYKMQKKVFWYCREPDGEAKNNDNEEVVDQEFGLVGSIYMRGRSNCNCSSWVYKKVFENKKSEFECLFIILYHLFSRYFSSMWSNWEDFLGCLVEEIPDSTQ